MPDLIVTAVSIAAMVLGFGAIIAVHEFGHFVAARLAGIRVHAFAIGFGQAIASYRKGYGLQRGSSEQRYNRQLNANATDADAPDPGQLPGVSPTEYRLNWIPFGGYVKMLGQDDTDPGATSDAPDSFQFKSIPKRIAVISAGVVMNILLAAVLFIAVYTAGLSSPAPVIAAPAPGSPADAAGLRAGDVITRVNGAPTRQLNDAVVAVAMSAKEETVSVTVSRDGGETTLTADPRTSGILGSGLRQLGLFPAKSATVWGEPVRASEYRALGDVLARAGLEEVPYRSQLVAVNDRTLPVRSLPNGQTYRLLDDAQRIIDNADPTQPVRLVFEHPTDRENEGTPPTTTATVGLEPAYQTNAVELPSVGTGVAMYPAEHLLGLAPLAKVADAAPAPPAQGLERGDVFLKVGDAAYPTVADAIREIRARARGRIDLLVQRAGPDGEPITVAIEAEVSAGGTVGFLPDNAWRLPVLGRTPEFLAAADEGEQASQRTSADLPAQRLGLRPVLPGTRIAAVVPPDPDATPIPVSSFAGLRDALRAATADALDAGESVTVTLRAEVLPPPAQIASLDAAEPAAATETPLPLTPRDIRRLHDLGYEAPGLAEAFRPVEVTIKADGPADALVMGAAATKRILTQTYLTLRRLVEGSVPVNKLQGPVGITYTGSRFAEQGLTKLLFFLALISANLAVINFLPIPITDGGQFLLLAWEGLRGKPAPVVVQNALTLIGLVLIASLFLYVTYHDILRIF